MLKNLAQKNLMTNTGNDITKLMVSAKNTATNQTSQLRSHAHKFHWKKIAPKNNFAQERMTRLTLLPPINFLKVHHSA